MELETTRTIKMEEDFESRKVFCCSNTARQEAKKLAVIDMVLGTFDLIILSVSFFTMRKDPELLRKLAKNANATLDEVNMLLDLPDNKQNFYLTFAMIGAFLSICMGGLMFYSAHKNHHLLAKLWIIIQMLILSMQIFVMVMVLMYLKRKVILASIFVIYYLYTFYEIWIVFNFTKNSFPGLRKVQETKLPKLQSPISSPKIHPVQEIIVPEISQADSLTESPDVNTVEQVDCQPSKCEGQEQPSDGAA